MRAKPRVSPPSCATSHSRTYARGRCGRDNNKQKQNISYELLTVYFVSYTYERLRANRAYRLYIWWLLCIIFLFLIFLYHFVMNKVAQFARRACVQRPGRPNCALVN